MNPTPLPPIAEVLRGKHLLVTGVTGFVGKVWLAHLLAHVPEIGRVTVLVRRTRTQSALNRMAEIADTSPAFRPVKRAATGEYAAWLDERLHVLEGDVVLPGCGLDDRALTELGEVDAIVHLAGLTDFQPDPRKGVPANVDGAVHIGQLALRLGARLVHVSTCFVAGMAEGEVPEALERGRAPLGQAFDAQRELHAVRALIQEHKAAPDRIDAVAAHARALGWPNLYTFTKGLAEHLLTGMVGLDLTIVRPSVVECARSFPLRGWNEGLNTSAPIMWFCGTAFRRFPASRDHHFDIVPVDAVARWISVVLARHLRGEAAPIYQLSSSDVNPTTYGRITELTALARRRDARASGGSTLDRAVAHLDIATHPADEQGWFNPDSVEALLTSLRDALPNDPRASMPRLLPDPVAEPLSERLRDARRDLTKQQRKIGQLSRMLELYQPFVHDHHWTFRSDRIREEVRHLHPDDATTFGDSIEQMCWRSYWLDVQYPGVKRWSFPILHNEEVDTDPPSCPPLELGQRVPHRLQGVA
jgi:thioester reductase-like protein